jgi:hypothetical protein
MGIHCGKWCTDFTQAEHRIRDLLRHETVELTSLRFLKTSHPMSSQSCTLNQRLSKHDQNTSPRTSLTATFWLCNQWDLISSPSLLTSNNFSWLLLTIRSPSVIFSLMSPFSETDYRIRQWNSLQLGHVITGISCLPSDSVSAWSS